MAELNKVPGLFPRRMAVSASSTVITQILLFNLTTQLPLCHSSVSTGTIWLCFSRDRLLGAPRELRRLSGETRSVCPDPTRGPARWWTDPPALLQRRRRRTSSAWCARAATMRNTTSRYVNGRVVRPAKCVAPAVITCSLVLFIFFLAPPPRVQQHQGHPACSAACGGSHRVGAAAHLQQRAGESVQQLHRRSHSRCFEEKVLLIS